MKNRTLLILILSTIGLGFSACKQDQVSNKIVDNLPIRDEAAPIPAFATQEFGLLKKAMLQVIVVSINQTTLTNPPPFTMLTPSGSNYEFTVREAHIGSADYTITFKDNNNITLSGIFTSSVAYVDVTGTGASDLFTYSDNCLITLTVPGNINADMLLSGNTPFTGINAAANYNITFTVPSPPGVRVNAEGLRGGNFTASGTGPTLPITMSFNTDNNHSIDGPLAWEGLTGQLHIGGAGVGFVVTDNARIPLN